MDAVHLRREGREVGMRGDQVMDANDEPTFNVTYTRYKHGRGFTWTAGTKFGDGRGSTYPTSGSLAEVSCWVREVIEDGHPSRSVTCISGFKFGAGRTRTVADKDAQEMVAALTVSREESTQDGARSALGALGLNQSDVDFVLGVVGSTRGSPRGPIQAQQRGPCWATVARVTHWAD